MINSNQHVQTSRVFSSDKSAKPVLQTSVVEYEIHFRSNLLLQVCMLEQVDYGEISDLMLEQVHFPKVLVLHDHVGIYKFGDNIFVFHLPSISGMTHLSSRKEGQ